MSSATILHYCCGAKPMAKVIELAGSSLSNVDYVDWQDLENECIHISEEEVNETIPLLDSNISYIADSMRDISVRDSWKNTRSDYHRIEAERCIQYDNAVIAAYSIGTTPIHTFLLRHLLSRHLSFSDSMHIVCLCGGSGAEILSFLLATSTHPKLFRFTIIDKEERWHSSLNAIEIDLKKRGFHVDVSFHSMDLLDPTNSPALQSILKTADVCTLVYGVSELLDYDSIHTQHLLSLIASSLPCNASLLIVDPVSHQFCCEKETLILRQVSASGQWHTCYQGHDKVSVSRSLLEPAIASYCQRLGLQINRDVKLSCHTWTLLLRKEGNLDTQHQEKRICCSTKSISTILILTQSPCIWKWQWMLHHLTHTNIWYITDPSNLAMMKRLVQSWQQFGGVLLLSYSRSLLSDLSISPSLLILHNYDMFCETDPHCLPISSSHIITTIQSEKMRERIYHDVKVMSGCDVIESLQMSCDDVMKSNEQRGVKCFIEKRDWQPTSVQEKYLTACGNDNNLRMLVLVHPSLLIGMKKKSIPATLTTLMQKKCPTGFDPVQSQRISIVIQEIELCKSTHSTIVVLCRLSSSIRIRFYKPHIVDALKSCIDFYNQSHTVLSYSVVDAFKRTQSKTMYRLARVTFDSDVTLIHISCLPQMEIEDEIDTLILFEATLGENKIRETTSECITSFFFHNRVKSMKVIKL